MVETDATALCRAVLAAGGFIRGGNLLVDGVRHVRVQRLLGDLVIPSVTKLIFIAVDDDNRLERVRDRDQGQSDFTRAEAHVVETDVKEGLPAIADAIIDGRDEPPAVVEKCLVWIRRWTTDT
jgi:hypothetical protein